MIAKMRKTFIWLVVSVFCMLTSLFFIGCGETDTYKNVRLVSTASSISMYVGQTVDVTFTIENPVGNMDSTLSFSSNVASIGKNSTEFSDDHVSLKVLSKYNGKIKVQITGKASGHSSIVATTQEGFKQCTLEVSVKQFSKNFNVDNSKMMYITRGDVLYPTSDYFLFDEGTTEREVKYYKVESETAALDGREFVGVKYVDNKCIFFDEEGLQVASQNCSVDGEYVQFLAIYSYKDKDESGTETIVSIKKMTKLVTLFGVDADDVQVYDSLSNIFPSTPIVKDENSLPKLQLVANVGGMNTKDYFVTVPTITDSIVDFGFEYGVTNKSIISFLSEELTNDVTLSALVKNFLNTNKLRLYKVSVTCNSSTSALDTEIFFKVFYVFDESLNYSNKSDSKVNYRLTVPTSIKLKPEMVEVTNQNEVVLTSSKTGENTVNEVFYNYYEGDAGWIEYHVKVYKTSSTFSGVRVDFSTDYINIIYDGKNFNTDTSFVVTDLSKPIYVRGVKGATATAAPQAITFTVKSELLTGDELQTELKYVVQDGAQSLTYTTKAFEARADGLVISSGSVDNTLVDIYADKDFKSFEAIPLNPGIVSVGNFKLVTRSVDGTILKEKEFDKDWVEKETGESDGKYYLSLSFAPIKTGEAIYTIRLDNGVSTTLKIKVVNTIDEHIRIGLRGNNPDVASFEGRYSEIEGFYFYEMVIRNAGTFGKRANIEVQTTYEDSLTKVETDFLDPGIFSLSTAVNIKNLTVISENKGSTDLIITATGKTVSNFVLGSIEKTTQITLISFVPVTDVKVFRKDPYSAKTATAEKAIVYARATDGMKTDSTEIVSNAAYLDVQISPEDAYYFYDEQTDKYVASVDKAEEFLYWTLSDGVYAIEQGTANYTNVMHKGKKYYISGTTTLNTDRYYGTFEFVEADGYYKFTANPNATSGIVFTLYASIRQYGLKKYFPVQIECRSFVPVTEIYTTVDISRYSFKNTEEKFEFVVYTNPYEATISGLKCVFVNTGAQLRVGTKDINIIDEEQISITPLQTTTCKAYLVSISLNPDFVRNLTDKTKAYNGKLYIVPNDWFNSAYNDISGIDYAKISQTLQTDITFQNGTRENPYVLTSAEDVVAIGKSAYAKAAHYVVYDMIDMSTVSSNEAYLIADTFSGSIRGATKDAGFKNIRIVGKTRYMFGEITCTDGFALDNLTFSGNIVVDRKQGDVTAIGLVAGLCESKVYNVSVVLDSNSSIKLSGSGNVYIGSMFGQLSTENAGIFQDFTRPYVEIAGALYGTEYVDIAGTKYIKYNIDEDEEKEDLEVQDFDVSGKIPYIEINNVKCYITYISKTTVFHQYPLNITAGGTGKILIGGIVGGADGALNTKIQKIDKPNATHLNYEGYTAYVDIQISTTTTNIVQAGGVVGHLRTATLEGLLVGGQVYHAIQTSNSGNNYIGGLIGAADGGESKMAYCTTRTFIRGYYAGLIVGYRNSHTGNWSNLTIQAVDDPKRIGIDASMRVAMCERAFDYLYSGYNNTIESGVLTQTYITRENLTISSGGSDTSTPCANDQFWGNNIYVYPTRQNGGLIKLINNSGFEVVAQGGMEISVAREFEKPADTPNTFATYAYYFDAQGYYENGQIVQKDLIKIQDLLGKNLNVLNAGSSGYPFAVTSGEDIAISSSSTNIDIDAYGNIKILGTGVACVNISSMLNRNNVVKVYIYVVNYFDVYSYRFVSPSTQDMFYIGTLVLKSETDFDVVGDNVVNVQVIPKMDCEYNFDSKIYSISNEGALTLNGLKIKLASANRFIDYDVQFAEKYIEANKFYEAFVPGETYYTYDAVADAYLPVADPQEVDFGTYFVYTYYGQTIKYDDGFFFAKKTETSPRAGSFDLFDINARLEFTADGKTFTKTLVDINDAKANYKKGATALTSNYSSYVLFTGKMAEDVFSITSDTKENLLCEIVGKNGHAIELKTGSFEYIKTFTGEEEIGEDPKYNGHLLEDESSLFIVKVARKTGNTFAVSVEINKESNAFKNRFVEDVYGTYYITFYSSSQGNKGVFKKIKIVYEQQDVNMISLISYNDIQKVLKNEEVIETPYVVPNQKGVISVSVEPVDADYDYIYFENGAINSQVGSTNAALSIGRIVEDPLDPKIKKFEEIQGVQSTKTGVRISKKSLDSAGISGAFYVQYLFGSYQAQNKAPEQILCYVTKDNSVVCQNKLDLELNIKYSIGLKLNGYENKTHIARGLSYDLEVINTGFDITALQVEIPEVYNSYASIEENDGAYSLIVSNNTIVYDVGEEGKKIEVQITATYIDALGEEKTLQETLPLTILEFVVNFEQPTSGNPDIIKGMTNGIVSTAVAEKTALSVDFNSYDQNAIEFNPENKGVKQSIIDFIDALNNAGTWTTYIDANDNGVIVYSNLDKINSNKFVFGNGKSSLDNVYFSVDELDVRTKRTHSPIENHYFFSYQGGYIIQNGTYVFSDSGNVIYTEFTLDSFVRGSMEHPNPIYNYEDFLDMNAGSHYILLNDIYIESEKFVPLTTPIASFDGNGYKFIFSNYKTIGDNVDKKPSNYDLSEFNQIGVFGLVSENAVIKNVSVQIGNSCSGDVVFIASPDADLTIGLVAATNSGIVTNAQVTIYEGVRFTISNNARSTSFVGGIVGSNSGFLTHSQSMLSVECQFNVAGVVGKNNGRIASCFYKGGTITNNVASGTVSIYTAGFAVENNGTISTSYTSRERTAINYNAAISWGDASTEKNIVSSVQAAGFVYTNGVSGKIYDCYSNLVVTSTGQTAGFVYVNNGACSNCLSFSLVNPNSTSDFGFASGDSVGTFENSYYLRDESKGINVSQKFTTIVGVDYKSIAEFSINIEDANDVASKFKTFSFTTENDNSTVWRYENSLKRLELIDANIIAVSRKSIDETATITLDDGTIIYSYTTVGESNGSKNNPYVINSPETFESYIANGSTAGKHYRIVCDLNYQQMPTDFVTTYLVDFGGNLYGNGMTISNISLYSESVLENAGLFGSITGTSLSYACVKDLTIKPTQVSFANAKRVGTLAGTIAYASLTNVNIYGSSAIEDMENDEQTGEDLCVVIGKNIVGGLVGLAKNKYTITNVFAKMSVMSTHITTTATDLLPAGDELSFLNSNVSKTSYAGGLIGFMSGTGSIKNVQLKNSSPYAVGSSVGFMFGFVGKGATAQDLRVKVNATMLMRSSVYAGIIAGGVYGTIDNVQIEGAVDETMLVSKVPYIPMAIGGVAGVAGSAKISNVYFGQKLIAPSIDGYQISVVENLGGIVGLVVDSTGLETRISKIVVNASLIGSVNVGGVIGRIAEGGSANLSEIAIKENNTFTVSGRGQNPVIGGFVGLCSGNLTLKDAYSEAKLEIAVFEYNLTIDAKIGDVCGHVGLSSISTNMNFIKIVQNVYTNHKYMVSMKDYSIVDSTVYSGPGKHENYNTYNEKNFILMCTNTFNKTGVINIQSVYNGSSSNNTQHIVTNYILSTTADTTFVTFAETLSEEVWTKVYNEENTTIKSVYLNFEKNL